MTQGEWRDGVQEWMVPVESLDRAELVRFVAILDQRPARLQGRTVGIALAEMLLQVRTREGRTSRLEANAAQGAFERRRG